MSCLEIRTYPDPVLLRKAMKVDAVDDEIRGLMDNMAETMYVANGLGLAAPQVGVSKRVIVLDTSACDAENGRLITLANPEIISAEGEDVAEEGCLSLPDFLTDVTRAERVVVRALGRDGNQVTIDAEGLLARVLQHEMDHLDGTLLLEKAGSLKREFYKKRVKKSLSKT